MTDRIVQSEEEDFEGHPPNVSNWAKPFERAWKLAVELASVMDVRAST